MSIFTYKQQIKLNKKVELKYDNKNSEEVYEWKESIQKSKFKLLWKISYFIVDLDIKFERC